MCLLLKYHLLTTFNAKKRTVDRPDVWSGVRCKQTFRGRTGETRPQKQNTTVLDSTVKNYCKKIIWYCFFLFAEKLNMD